MSKEQSGNNLYDQATWVAEHNDTFFQARELIEFNPQRVAEVLRTNPLWYRDWEISACIDEFIAGSEKENEEWKTRKKEFLNVFVQAWERNEILLGDRPEGFNDDDRWWAPEKGGWRVNPKEEEATPTTFVVHHTHTAIDASSSYLEVLGLLRLYVPLYRSSWKGPNKEFIPISSGHYRDGKQTFLGYHYLIFEDGSVLNTLKDEYTGFHASDYPTNCRSYGAAIVDSLMGKEPSEAAIASLANLIKQKKIALEKVIGHKEVVFSRTGQRVETECPGDKFEGEGGWKAKLLRLLAA